MRTETITIYKFTELSDTAKERARGWFRACIEVEEWASYAIDDAIEIGALIGLEISRPVCFDLDRRGITFSWSYAYVSGGLRAIKAQRPGDTHLHNAARRLQKLQQRNFYQLKGCEGRYGVYTTRADGAQQTPGADIELDDCIQQFKAWVLSELRAEYEYQTSDEVIDETLATNDYEFTVVGEAY